MSKYVGFVGLGNMGTKMAANLISKGEKLKVYDILPAAAQSVKGAEVCSTPREAATDCSVVITMLPTGDIVRDVVSGKDGILESIPKDAILVDSSTIEPKAAQGINKLANDAGIRFVDAPVSGGVVGAAAATLTFMVGGEKEVFEKVTPLLKKMGGRVLHCGDHGAGQVAKLCNNLILAASMTAVSESMNLGIKLGLDPKTLAEIINTSTGRCWSSDTYNPVPHIIPNVPSCKDYDGGFMCNLVAKDLGLAESVAVSCGAPVPMTAVTHQLYRTMIANGYGTKDFSAIYQFLKGNVNK